MGKETSGIETWKQKLGDSLVPTSPNKPTSRAEILSFMLWSLRDSTCSLVVLCIRFLARNLRQLVLSSEKNPFSQSLSRGQSFFSAKLSTEKKNQNSPVTTRLMLLPFPFLLANGYLDKGILSCHS